MAQVTITINSREYAISCEDGQEVRILQLARLMDEKARLLNAASGQVNESMLLAMIGLLLADELSELKKPGVQTTPAPEAPNSPRILELDSLLADRIKSLNEEIKSLASRINLL